MDAGSVMKQLLKISAIIAILTILISMLFIAIPWQNLPSKDFTVIASFALNGLFWGLLLFYELTKRAYSLLIIHWLFCFLFFFCIAFAQYMHGVFPWVASRPDGLLLETNLLLLVWTVFVLFGYKISFTKKLEPSDSSNETFQIPTWLVIGLTGFTITNTLYRIAEIGVHNLLAQATARISYGIESSAMGLLAAHVLQAIAFFAVVLTFISYKQKHKGIVFLLITFVCLVLSYFPFALSRYAAAAIYGSLLLIMFSSLHKNRFFILAFIIGFIVIFPFLNAFRNTAFTDVDISNTIRNIFRHLAEGWLAGDYDAYSMLTLTVEYISHYGITWGMQFLGVLLFWIPRTWWLTKPIGTGAFVSTQLGWQFTNLSAPLPAEGFINLGIGYLLFAVVLGWIMSKLDTRYWLEVDKTDRIVRRYDLLYPVLIMFFFFMNRGDLLSSTAYMMAYVATWWILSMCCRTGKI